MSLQELSEQELFRRESLKKLRDMGIEPFPAQLFPVDTMSQEIKDNYTEGNSVCLAGRIMSKRIMGKASFAELQDSSGRIQLYFNRDEICPGEDKSMYNDVFKKLLDLGDFIGVHGTVFKTQVGEVSVNITKLSVVRRSSLYRYLKQMRMERYMMHLQILSLDTDSVMWTLLSTLT